MPILEALIGPVSRIIDKVIPDPAARDRAKLELLKLESSADFERIRAQLSAIIAEAESKDPWTSRARPPFFYKIYAILVGNMRGGVKASSIPPTATSIAEGMSAYLRGLPEPLYALFGTGYLGYAVMRQWGKSKGTDR